MSDEHYRRAIPDAAVVGDAVLGAVKDGGPQPSALRHGAGPGAGARYARGLDEPDRCVHPELFLLLVGWDV